MAIDEKLLIESLEKLKQEVNMPVDIVWNNLLKVCIDTINEQPKVDEWISCTVVDHPEHCNDCEVTRKDTIGYVRDIAFYTDRWRRLADEMPVDVVAWK